MSCLSFPGAGDEARTRYLHLGKVALYQMSYIRIVPTQCLFIINTKRSLVKSRPAKNRTEKSGAFVSFPLFYLEGNCDIICM